MTRNFGSTPVEISEDQLGFPSAGAGQRETIFRNYALGPVYDQGSKFTCVDCAVRGLLAADPVRQNPFGEDVIYHASRASEGMKKDEGPGGTSILAAVDFIKSKGLVKKEYYTNRAAEVVVYINDVSPVVFSLPWFSGMDKPEKDGRIKVGGSYVGHHAFMAYRWDGLKKRCWIRNSYGRDWGLEGNGYLTEKDLGKLFDWKGSLAVAITENLK